MNKLNNMQVFCRIVELGTFAGVAREMNLSAMMISKYVAQLEKYLGVVLINRTTRSLIITEAGQAYYNRSKQLLEDFNDLEESTSQMGNTVKGNLRINAPIDFGGMFMVSAIDQYQKIYPEVNILMTLDNKKVNLSQADYDIAILVTDSLDPGVIARKISQTELCTYASPDYLLKNGTPNTINDLLGHRCLYNTNTPHGEHWVLNDNEKITKIKNDWSFASNNVRALCKAAALGMGIVQAPKISVTDYIEKNQLVEILPEFKIASLMVYATYLQRRFYPAKLTTLIDFLTTFFNNNVIEE